MADYSRRCCASFARAVASAFGITGPRPPFSRRWRVCSSGSPATRPSSGNGGSAYRNVFQRAISARPGERARGSGRAPRRFLRRPEQAAPWRIPRGRSTLPTATFRRTRWRDPDARLGLSSERARRGPRAPHGRGAHRAVGVLGGNERIAGDVPFAGRAGDRSCGGRAFFRIPAVVQHRAKQVELVRRPR